MMRMQYTQARDLVRKELKWCYDSYMSYDEAYDHIEDWLRSRIKAGRFDYWSVESYKDLVSFKDTLLSMWFNDF